MKSFLYGVLLLMPWCAVLTVGSWKVSHRTSASPAPLQRRVVASHTLPANWLIRETDLKGDAAEKKPFLGLYVVGETAEGHMIALPNLEGTPKASPAAGKVLYRFALTPALSMDLNVGGKLAIFQGGPALIPEASVLAVECGASCVAILELSQAESNVLSAAPPEKLVAIRR
jgi:hypothetical protein